VTLKGRPGNHLATTIAPRRFLELDKASQEFAAVHIEVGFLYRNCQLYDFVALPSKRRQLADSKTV
jgi:hypothetical protein